MFKVQQYLQKRKINTQYVLTNNYFLSFFAGFGNNLVEEEKTIESLVNVLKDEIKFIHAFVICFKQQVSRGHSCFHNVFRQVGRPSSQISAAHTLLYHNSMMARSTDARFLGIDIQFDSTKEAIREGG